jgi:hypothetical protein
VIAEAYRPITVREGGRVERMPVIQAILRKVFFAAANGNVRVQQQVLNLVTGTEADRRLALMEMLKTAVDYKEHWDKVLFDRERNGTTGPEPVPHPDDVLIDPTTWEVHIDGPDSQKQKAAQDALHAKWIDYEREIQRLDEKIKSDPDSLTLRKQQAQYTEIVDWIRQDRSKRNLRNAARKLMAGKQSTD